MTLHFMRVFAAVGVVLHEGWCIKESGTAFLGKTNWRKRWFKLVQNRRDVLMQYYRLVSKLASLLLLH